MHPLIPALVRLATPSLAALLCVLPAARAGVFVVDLAGGGDFTSLGAAITASVDGDILVIKPGDYSSSLLADLDGKALVIVGDTGGEVLLPTIWVHNLEAGDTVVLRGLHVKPNGTAAQFGGTVFLQGNLGRVHIEDCVIEGLPGAAGSPSTANPGVPGLRITESVSTVAVHRSTITGGSGVSTAPGPSGQFVNSHGAPAVMHESGQLALYGVTAEGGDGGSGEATSIAGDQAGAGLLVSNAHVFVAGCHFVGGDGGSGEPAGLSGPGLLAGGEGPTHVVIDLDCEFEGGAGAPGLEVVSGTRLPLPGSAWTLETSAPVRSGSVGTITANGPPSELFGIFLSFDMDYLPKVSLQGVFLLTAPFQGPLILATTDGAGHWSTPFVAPNLATFGLEGLLTIDQALMQQDTGPVLSSATAYIQVQPPN